MIAPFFIVGEDDSGCGNSFARPTITAALAKAAELLKEHKKNIRIIDAEGRVFTEADFPQLK